MTLRKFSIWLVKNLLILFVITLAFSSVTFSLPNFLKGVFEDVFTYANPESQKRVVSQLAETCSSLDQSGTITTTQLCSNKSLLSSMEEDCMEYRNARRKGLQFENEAEIQESCSKIESGEIEKRCEAMEKGSFYPDFNKIGTLCKDYKSGRINDKEFFYGVLSSPLDEKINLPSLSVIDKYNRAINYLNKNKIFYFIIIIALAVLLYFLIGDLMDFLIVLTDLSFVAGTIILIPYVIIVVYDVLFDIDTSSILGSMIGLVSLDLKAILSVVLLMILRTYSNLIITTGILFIAVGTIGKVYKIFYKKPEEKAKVKKSKKMNKLFGELKEEMKKRKKKS